jgi:hypothetical protein
LTERTLHNGIEQQIGPKILITSNYATADTTALVVLVAVALVVVLVV